MICGLKRSRFATHLTSAVFVMVLAGCGTLTADVSTYPEVAEISGAETSNKKQSEGYELPKKASPQLRSVVSRAAKAERERDKAEARALDAVEGVPLPSPGATDGPGEGGGIASQPAGTAQPTESETLKPEEPQATPSPVVPPEVKAAINAYVDYQLAVRRNCKNLQVVAQEEAKPSSGLGRSSQPMTTCGGSSPPPELVPWILALGYDPAKLVDEGVHIE